MSITKRKVQQFKNSVAIIKQIRNDEWEFKGHREYSHNENSFKCFTAERNDVELWLANGCLSCGIRDKRWELGFVGGLMVWFLAAKKRLKALEKANRPVTSDLTA
ncbi:hypothetical protein [Vibrio crassostreae]|uniref:hypothetical protein n=1 Tax=Vibrio crassostreae TaxID=246167 RepID=UPI001B30F271|nr:hypothetical protein [Vibrio crassostreae]